MSIDDMLFTFMGLALEPKENQDKVKEELTQKKKRN